MHLFQFLCEMTYCYTAAMGNGPVTLPLVRKSIVEDRGVLSADRLIYAYASAQLLPGQTVLYFASLGYMLFGFAAAILVIAVVNASAFVIVPVTGWYHRFKDVKAVQRFTSGLNSAAFGLTVAATISLTRHTLNRPVCWLVFGLALYLMLKLKWSPLASLTVAASAGLILVA